MRSLLKPRLVRHNDRFRDDLKQVRSGLARIPALSQGHSSRGRHYAGCCIRHQHDLHGCCDSTPRAQLPLLGRYQFDGNRF